MNYLTITSAYLREKIRETSWSQHVILDELVRLYRYIQNGGPSNYTAALQFHLLKDRYPQEYLALLEEHSPEAFKAHLQKTVGQQEALRNKIIAEKEESDRAEQTAREEWLLAGGLV